MSETREDIAQKQKKLLLNKRIMFPELEQLSVGIVMASWFANYIIELMEITNIYPNLH